ncbi:MAG: carbohydrate ABC transporter permease [Candidatus Riflebacteria bacterium]
MKKHGTIFEKALLVIFVLTVLFLNLLPFALMLFTSFKAEVEITSAASAFFPENWTLDNYRHLASIFNVWGHLLNSLLFAGGVTLISLVLNALAAYAFACIEFPGREKLFSLLLLTMFVPSQVTLIPTFLILKYLGLLNTLVGLILPGSASVVGIFLLRQFMKELPMEILDQAEIDGCSDFQKFFRIILPLSKPSLMTLAVFTFVGCWNEFLGPLVVMLKESGYPIPVALATLRGTHQTEWGMLMAGAVMTMLPSIVVFLLAQRYYLEGITRGAVR